MKVDSAKRGLPSKDSILTEAISSHMQRATAYFGYRQALWKLGELYTKGQRAFDLFDPDSGRVIGRYPVGRSDKGQFDLSVPELLSIVNKVSGAINGMDIRPSVVPQGAGLGQLRDRAVADVIISSLVDEEQARKTHRMWSTVFALKGMAGIQAHMNDLPIIGLTGDLEMVPPEQLFPWPMVDMNLGGLGGIIRQRLVPISELQQVYGKRQVNAKLDKMSTYINNWGDFTHDRGVDHSVRPQIILQDGNQTSKGLSDTELQEVLVQIQEIYIYGPRDTLIEHAVISQDAVLSRDRFDTVTQYCPLQIARFFETGDFYGAGLMDLLFSPIREFERMVKDAINNVREFDQYGLTLLPAGTVNDTQQFRDTGTRMKYAAYMPRPSFGGREQSPIQIRPYSAGEVPGRTAAFLQQIIDRLSPISDIVREKGRIDSADALRFLHEKDMETMSNPISSMIAMYGGVYRYLTASGAYSAAITSNALPVSHVTLDMAGVVIDFSENIVHFGEVNPLPDVSRLRFTVRDASLRSQSLRKQEAIQMFQIHGDIESLMLLHMEEGLDFAIWDDEYEAAYETVKMNILTLYSDGLQPGEIVLTPSTESPDLQLRVLKAFMAKPVMRSASPDVVDAFQDYHDYLMQQTGLMLPPGVPDAVDAAMATQQAVAPLQRSIERRI